MRGGILILGLICTSVPVSGCSSCSSGCSEPGVSKGSGAKSVGPKLLVPRKVGVLKLDGELGEEDWQKAARTGAFVESETSDAARPYSEARFLYDDDNLYFALYAADENILFKVKEHDGPVWLDDSFSMRIRRDAEAPIYQVDISAGGVITDVSESSPRLVNKAWESGAVIGLDQDGTPNDPSDDDEEWVVEGSLPFSSIQVVPGPHVKLYIRVARCDTPKDGKRRCGYFGDAGPGSPPAAVLELQ